jgi:hypothetical protein
MNFDRSFADAQFISDLLILFCFSMPRLPFKKMMFRLDSAFKGVRLWITRIRSTM